MSDKPMLSRDWLIWSNEHGAWWRPDSAGYTNKVESAGRYSEAEAKAICRNGGSPRSGSRNKGPYEVAVLSPEASERLSPLPASGRTSTTEQEPTP